MNTILEYPNINAESYALNLCNRDNVLCSPVYNWMMYYKLPTDISVNPKYTKNIITESAKNRYLRSVEISAINPAVIEVTLAANATATFNFTGISTAETSNATFATVDVENGVAKVTAVAAGTATITIYDSTKNIIATITVTIPA